MPCAQTGIFTYDDMIANVRKMKFTMQDGNFLGRLARSGLFHRNLEQFLWNSISDFLRNYRLLMTFMTFCGCYTRMQRTVVTDKKVSF